MLGRLDRETGQFAQAHWHLSLAHELANACAAPFVRAQTLVGMSELLLAEGRPADAAPLLTAAMSIAADLGAVPLRTTVEALVASGDERAKAAGFPSGLSQREVEVLRLVAQGLTDGAVAERLFISSRTVSQHLRSIYGKLNVSSRAAATRFAVEHQLV
jgi:DNA-binding NarL/FixJ family response regulator